jgi:hypothetical protein
VISCYYTTCGRRFITCCGLKYPQQYQRLVILSQIRGNLEFGRQENSADNGHFASIGNHPLRLFNREGDCLAAKIRPGNVHSAED